MKRKPKKAKYKCGEMVMESDLIRASSSGVPKSGGYGEKSENRFEKALKFADDFIHD